MQNFHSSRSAPDSRAASFPGPQCAAGGDHAAPGWHREQTEGHLYGFRNWKCGSPTWAAHGETQDSPQPLGQPFLMESFQASVTDL